MHLRERAGSVRPDRSRGVAVGPGARLLELRGDAEQHVLAPVRGDELHADREPVGVQCSGSEIAGWPVTLNGS